MSSGSQPSEEKGLSDLVAEALVRNEDFDPAGISEEATDSSGMAQKKETAKWSARANDLWHYGIEW